MMFKTLLLVKQIRFHGRLQLLVPMLPCTKLSSTTSPESVSLYAGGVNWTWDLLRSLWRFGSLLCGFLFTAVWKEVNESNDTNGTNESSFMDLADPQMGSPIQAGSNTALSQRVCEDWIHWTLVQRGCLVCKVESTPLSIINALQVLDSTYSVESCISVFVVPNREAEFIANLDLTCTKPGWVALSYEVRCTVHSCLEDLSSPLNCIVHWKSLCLLRRYRLCIIGDRLSLQATFLFNFKLYREMTRLLGWAELVHDLFSTSLVLSSYITTVPLDIRELTTNFLHILYILHSFSAFPSLLQQVRKRRHLEQSQLTSRKVLEHGFYFQSHARSWCLWFAKKLTGFRLLHRCRLRFDSERHCSDMVHLILLDRHAIPPLFRFSNHSAFVFCGTWGLVQAFENVSRFVRTKSLRFFFSDQE